MSNVSRYASLSFAALLFAAANACAQSYPAKQIRFVVPFPPGGPADILSRTIGQVLSEAWSQQVVIDNRAGAGGNICRQGVGATAPAALTTLLRVCHPQPI